MNAIVQLDTVGAVQLVPSSGGPSRITSRRRLPTAITARTARGGPSARSQGNPLLRAIATAESLPDEEQTRLLIAYRRAEDDIDRILAEAPRTAAMISELVPQIRTQGRLSEFFHMDKRPGSAMRAGAGRDLAAHYEALCQDYLRRHGALRTLPGARVPASQSRELLAAFTALNLAVPLRESIISRIIADGANGACRETRSLAIVLRHATWERDEARLRVETGNLRFVMAIARRMKAMAPAMDMGDLVGEGMTGLRRAIQKFDPRRGNRFSTYAIWWIRQSISRAIGDRNLLARTRGPGGEGEPGKGGKPRPVEFVSLDEPMPGQEDRYLKDVIADTDAECAETGVAKMEMRRAIRRVVALLPERERTIIAARFGIGRPEMDIGKISDMLGVTRERIRQIERDALNRLAACARLADLKCALG